MLNVIIFLFIGLLVGTISAMIGIGGGIIIVPLMTFVFKMSPQTAIGTSMMVILLCSISSSTGYMRKRLVYKDAAWRFALATIPGAVMGGYIVDFVQGKLFYGIFGIFFILFSLNMFFQSTRKKYNQKTEIPSKYNSKLGILCSFVVGFISSLLGIGGGVIHVPMMTYVLKFPIKVAIATSSAILVVSASAGVISHAYFGHILLNTAIPIGIGACIGAQFGVHFASKAKSSLLIQMLAFVVFLIGIKFLSGLFN